MAKLQHVVRHMHADLLQQTVAVRCQLFSEIMAIEHASHVVSLRPLHAVEDEGFVTPSL